MLIQERGMERTQRNGCPGPTFRGLDFDAFTLIQGSASGWKTANIKLAGKLFIETAPWRVLGVIMCSIYRTTAVCLIARSVRQAKSCLEIMVFVSHATVISKRTGNQDQVRKKRGDQSALTAGPWSKLSKSFSGDF